MKIIEVDSTIKEFAETVEKLWPNADPDKTLDLASLNDNEIAKLAAGLTRTNIYIRTLTLPLAYEIGVRDIELVCNCKHCMEKKSGLN